VLAFVIKSYPERDGVTARLPDLVPGDHVLIGDPWGAIADKGPGVFLAAGAGITPFIAILSARARAGTLAGCSLHFANRTEADAILRPYWDGLEDLETAYLFGDPAGDAPKQQLDAAYLDAAISDWDQRFYVCGPPKFEEQAIAHLSRRGVPESMIVAES
jgi:ferredoxin-NADP reductase